MDLNSQIFMDALLNNDIDALRQIPKSDLHNHQSRAANKHDLEQWLNVTIPSFPRLSSVVEMDQWYRQHIKGLTVTRDTFELKIKSAFLEAKRENVTVLCLSIGPGDMQYFNNDIQEFINTIERYRNQIAPDILFLPELSLCRTDNNDFNQYQISTVTELLKLNYFKSIDLVGDENISPAPFRELWHTCRTLGMMTRIHVGESTSHHNIADAIRELDVQHIQHGISASESPELMKLLREKNITLHICPTSNVMLSNTKDYTFPQLRTLIDNDISITINTDDLLIFDSTISEEYLKLYQGGNFTAQELDRIRLYGLTISCN
jgi:adenosine deaminase